MNFPRLVRTKTIFHNRSLVRFRNSTSADLSLGRWRAANTCFFSGRTAYSVPSLALRRAGLHSCASQPKSDGRQLPCGGPLPEHGTTTLNYFASSPNNPRVTPLSVPEGAQPSSQGARFCDCVISYTWYTSIDHCCCVAKVGVKWRLQEGKEGYVPSQSQRREHAGVLVIEDTCYSICVGPNHVVYCTIHCRRAEEIITYTPE